MYIKISQLISPYWVSVDWPEQVGIRVHVPHYHAY